jgi:hypothetical protein
LNSLLRVCCFCIIRFMKSPYKQVIHILQTWSRRITPQYAFLLFPKKKTCAFARTKMTLFPSQTTCLKNTGLSHDFLVGFGNKTLTTARSQKTQKTI